MKYSYFFILTILLFHPLSESFPQNSTIQSEDSTKTYRLGDVVVSATKTKISTIELANSISVIDSEEISKRNSFRIYDLLKSEYGLSFTSQGGPGTLSNIYLRGGSASHTSVIVDGIELNLTSDPNGVYDFASFSTYNIDRIEILRGPQSVLYGSDALAGVINIITKKGSGTPRLNFSAEGGSYNTFRGNTSLNGNLNKLFYSFSLGRIKSDGFSAANEKYGNSEKDGYRKDNISTVIGYDISNDINSQIYLRYNNSEADYDQSGINGDDPTYKFDQEEFSIRSETEIMLFNNIWNQKIGAAFIRNIRKYSYSETINNPTASRSLYDGRKMKFEWQNIFHLTDNNTLSAGLDFETDEVTSEFYSYSSFGNFTSLFPKNDVSTVGGYIQNQFRINNDFFASAGIRLDDHQIYGTSITYRFAPAYIFWATGTKLKATVGTGFKAPSLFYLYDPAFGNPELNPENSFGWDVGIEQFLWEAGLSFGATFFSNDYSDLFGFDSNFKTININKAETRGIELYSSLKVLDDLSGKINYTFTEAKDKSPGVSPAKEKLIRRPEHKVGLYLSYNFTSKTNLNVEMIYVGEREDLDFGTFPSTRVKMDPFLLVNLATHYKLFDFLKLNLRIENLMDSDYEEVFGYGTAGISFYGGIDIILF